VVAARLLERGFEKEDVAKIMGGNWINVLRQTFE